MFGKNMGFIVEVDKTHQTTVLYRLKKLQLAE
jgi:hypothetical protein